ncbi:MAG TPA: hypothetical protein VHO72_01510 [Bacteroidales bacterium]|nr:hypothetical protein [Bacteroidales bacterium]
MKNKLKRRGIAIDVNKKLNEAELTFDDQSDDDVCGFGRLIANDAAAIIINAYDEHVSKMKGETQNKAVTFGKEALLDILSQRGCEGIRFYFGKRNKDLWEKGSKYSKFEGLTLVAVGVDANNEDLGPMGGSITSRSAMAKGSDQSQETKIYEVVPPWP